MIVEGFLPKPDAVLHANTGDHPSYVLEQIEYSRKRLASVGVPLIVVTNGNMHDDLYSGGRFAAMPLFTKRENGVRGKKETKSHPSQQELFDISEFEAEEPKTIKGFGVETTIIHTGIMRRQCTSEYKIVPIERELRIMLLEMGLAKQTKTGAIRVSKNVLVESWIGYSMDEVERIKPSRNKWQIFRYPLIEKRMKRSDLYNWLNDRGLPTPLSSACIKCPVISDERAIELKTNDPKGYENRVQFDRDLRNGNLRIAASAKGELFLSDRLIPLDEVALEPERPMLIGCHGICFT